MTPEIVHQ